MGKAHRPCEELEGQRLRIDVGSTKEEALASQENATIYFTKDKSIVMNGVAFSDGTAQQPVMVNVCRAIPTRPRKGQVYFFENRICYRLKRNLMQEGDVFTTYENFIVRRKNGKHEWIKNNTELNITRDNWPFTDCDSVIVIDDSAHSVFVRVERDGFVGDDGVLSILHAKGFVSQQIMPSSPNFEFCRNPSHFDINGYQRALLRVKCIAEPPTNTMVSLSNIKKYAHFLLRNRKHIALTYFGYIKILDCPLMKDEAEVHLCRNDLWRRKRFYIISTKRRGKVSDKKVFVRRVEYPYDPGVTYLAVQPLENR